ncbi:sulfotransferase [Colwellia sp. 1_MG-2023]|uniref:tetratricopeptide repeat-containing sulfotransferase family protein n=1 Tax=Colwellia sp. 1_MG-2023 TaxID=3062649 RepID=UPI0026E422DD|nr:tetratricopeptide repeat-containing sulfotransferase family protein [Colwellia sp. 1_MG-2023]MDO6446152.1 sulfotransferase [Colwellia sp. 1_MG-2023]
MLDNNSFSTSFPTNPVDIESRLDQAWTYINERKVSLAQQACQKINQDFPKNADGWYATSFLDFQLKQFPTAIIAIDKAIGLQPHNFQWQYQKVTTLLSMSDKVQAIKLAENLKNLRLTNSKQCSDFAVMFTHLMDYQQANFYYQQALTIVIEKQQPKQCAQLYFNLASIERYQGEIELAEQHLNKAISLNPQDFEAYLLRSSLKKQTPVSNHIKPIEQVLSQGIKHPIGKAQMHYALAKELEDLGLFTQSFTQLNHGATVRRAYMKYDVKHDLSTIQKIRTTFNQSLFNKKKGLSVSCDNDEAIFILGLPRTGSTLVERIVSGHRDVFSAGELNNFALCMMDEVKNTTSIPPNSRQALVELTSELNFKRLGENYIKSTRPETGHTKHFIDKLPLNSLYIGLIHLALPNAKVIHVTRHPLDTCYSIYKQLFTNGYPFSYDLIELAQYYIEHHKMMQHWYSILPGVIHQVAYEDVVNDLTTEAKKLIAFCQLDWQSTCSDFQNNTAPSTTASATQVRQKIYKSSHGKWRQFEKELLPIKQLLEQAGICCD